MNARLKTAPKSAREIVLDLSPQLDLILSRVLQRNPIDRYASAQEFPYDLEHQDRVGLADRAAPGGGESRRKILPKRVLLYGALAILPVMLFVLTLFVARLP